MARSGIMAPLIVDKEIEMSYSNEREIAMYGCTVDQLRESVERNITFKFSGPAMCAMSMMSDAQEEMAYGMTENARKTINRAKWIISAYVLEQKFIEA